jgi:hypothetical protein
MTVSTKGRLRAAILAATVAVMAFGIADAQAARIDTEFGDTGVNCGAGPDPNHCLYSGFITSPKNKCLAGRTVKMFALFTGGGQKLVDTDRTSKHGAFAGLGKPSTVSAAKFKVLEKRVHGDTCKADKFVGA